MGADEYDESNPLGGLLGAILGKEVDQETNSAQTTAATTNTASTNTSQATGQQATTGTTQNTGTQSTTGTIQKSVDTTNAGTGSETVSAELTGLREAYARQSAGITPEMLAAIFQQGAKAAPQLVTANAQALGARMQGNTPVAGVLQQLQMDMTSKAADLNRQLLSDSAQTAGKIGDLTRSTSKTFSEAGSSIGTDVQNLLTATDSTQLASQIINSINNTNAAATTTGTQNQQVTAAENKETSTTINSGVAKSLVGAFVGGTALSALWKQAQSGQGFGGTLAQFAKQLWAAGAPLNDINAQLVEAGFPIIDGSNAGGDFELPDYDYTPPDYESPIPELPESPDYDYDDWSGWADGGVPAPKASFLPSPQLIKKKPELLNPDADLQGLLSGLDTGVGDQLTSMLGGSQYDEGMIGAGGGDSGGGTSGGGTSSSSNSTGRGGTVGTGTGTSISNVGLGTVGRGFGVAASIAQGNVVGAVLGMIGLANSMNTGMAQFGEESASTVGGFSEGLSLSGQVDVADGFASVTGLADLDGGYGGYGGDGGIGSGPGGADGNAGDAGSSDAGSTGAGGDTGGDAGSGGDGTGSGGDTGGGGSGSDSGGGGSDGGDGGDGDGGDGWANGGIPSPEQEEQDYMLNAMGFSRSKSGLSMKPQAVKMIHRALTKQPGRGPSNAQVTGVPGMANGGKIVGPGTGTSDSVPAVAGGRPIRVANGEFIIPADVVQKFGEQAFNKLVAEHHIPAEMQQAITGVR